MLAEFSAQIFHAVNLALSISITIVNTQKCHPLTLSRRVDVKYMPSPLHDCGGWETQLNTTAEIQILNEPRIPDIPA